MSTHNICFRGEIRKLICGYPLLSVATLYADLILFSFNFKNTFTVIFLISPQKHYAVGITNIYS